MVCELSIVLVSTYYYPIVENKVCQWTHKLWWIYKR